MAETAIQALDLSKKFGNFTAVDKVNFKLAYGEIFGFLGPNGAGKSTTIRMLCGILKPTSGRAVVAGFDASTEAEKIKESIGYVSQKFSLYTDLTVEENLEFYGSIYDLSPSRLRERIQAVYSLTGLGAWTKKISGTLSGGWKQRLALGNALLHDPKILFLDEPTAGVDPVSRRALWEVLYELAESGKALFVTTHYMEEAERCNQIAFISNGKLLRIGSPQGLKEEISGNLLEVECRPLMKASRFFKDIPGVEGITAYGTTLHLNIKNSPEVEKKLHETAKKEHLEILSIKPIKASLEDIFTTITEKN